MSSGLPYKLLQFEVVPPINIWNSISERLDVEFDPVDIRVSLKMEQSTVVPPVFIWDKIRESLDTPDEISRKKPGKVISFTYRRIAVAAAFFGLIAFTAWYFLRLPITAEDDGLAVTTTIGTVVNSGQNTPGLQSDAIRKRVHIPASGYVLAAIRPMPIRRSFTLRKVEIKKVPVNASTISITAASPPIAIKAPPIRDANGQLVMDFHLLKSSQDHYIKVTSPNGEQTRISDKFLNMLHYLNTPDDDYTPVETLERRLWKVKIREWKNKLIQHAGFVPSDNNFLDIIELRDLIQDR